MRLYFNRCRVCGQAHDVGAPHKFGKAADVRRGQSSQLSPADVETLADAFNSAVGSNVALTPIGASQRRPGRPKKIENNV